MNKLLIITNIILGLALVISLYFNFSKQPDPEPVEITAAPKFQLKTFFHPVSGFRDTVEMKVTSKGHEYPKLSDTIKV